MLRKVIICAGASLLLTSCQEIANDRPELATGTLNGIPFGSDGKISYYAIILQGSGPTRSAEVKLERTPLSEFVTIALLRGQTIAVEPSKYGVEGIEYLPYDLELWEEEDGYGASLTYKFGEESKCFINDDGRSKFNVFLHNSGYKGVSVVNYDENCSPIIKVFDTSNRNLVEHR